MAPRTHADILNPEIAAYIAARTPQPDEIQQQLIARTAGTVLAAGFGAFVVYTETDQVDGMSFNVPGGITEYAEKHAIDLIVVGTHGRGAVKQLLLGSAAERVVRNAPCPVLAVRAKERHFIALDALVATEKA